MVGSCVWIYPGTSKYNTKPHLRIGFPRLLHRLEQVLVEVDRPRQRLRRYRRSDQHATRMVGVPTCVPSDVLRHADLNALQLAARLIKHGDLAGKQLAAGHLCAKAWCQGVKNARSAI